MNHLSERVADLVLMAMGLVGLMILVTLVSN